MRTKTFFFLFVCSLFWSCNTQKCKLQLNDFNETISKIRISNNFSNDLILKGQKGQLFLIDSIQEIKIVYVRWENGYSSYGKLKNGSPVEYWHIYDNKNRLRKYIRFGYTNNAILFYRKYNKRGKLISNPYLENLSF
jgi:hypothetical protein